MRDPILVGRGGLTDRAAVFLVARKGEGFLADAYHAQAALFTGHWGILFGPDGFTLAPWSPLKGSRIHLGLTYMGKRVDSVR